MSNNKKNEAKLRNTEKTWKESNNDESDFSENEIPDLNSLKSFQFEPITNIGDINSSSSDEEEGTEYKVKRILSGVSAVQNQSLADVLQNRCQACNFIKKRLQHRCFPMKFEKFLRAPLFTEHLYSSGCF